MANQRGMRHADGRELIALEPAASERAELELAPREQTVASFVMTRAAQRSWEIVNRSIAGPRGAMFWIVGPAGSGKTHFLNYVLALESRAATPAAEPGRHLLCGFELAGRVIGSELEAYLLDTLAEQIGAERQSAALWRELGGADAVSLAMEQARRTGLRAVTIAIDFSASDSEPAAAYFLALANLARSCAIVRLTVIAAGRASAPDGAIALAVAPANRDELMRVAIARARVVHEDDESREAVQELIHELYAGVDLLDFDPPAIFPFHPLTVRTLGTLAEPSGNVAIAARLAREAIASQLESGGAEPKRLLYCADLMDNAAIKRRVEERLGDAGRAALKTVENALTAFHGNERILAREIGHAVAVEHALGGTRPMPIAELEARVPMLAAGAGVLAGTLVEIVRCLEDRTAGVIRADGAGEIIFDPAGALVPEAARFNAAIALTRRFEPSLELARDAASVRIATESLAEALAGSVEAASRTRETLVAAFGEANLAIPAEHTGTLDDYTALAEGGVGRIIDIGADPARRAAALQVVSAYESLAIAAEVVPRMRAMREFVEATGLRIPAEEDPARDPRITALETECHLLLAELAPRMLGGAPRGFDALEARFQKFKWTYVQLYQAFHSAWKSAMERDALVVDDARRLLDALMKLDLIGALGPALGPSFALRVATLQRRVIQCDRAVPSHLEVTPRCAGCAYLMGASSPRAELEDLVERLERALRSKLAALSHSAIARLIREHDRAHRLDGLLKMIQAAQTDTLVRVLDDKLARYLARLLDENLGTGGEVKAQGPTSSSPGAGLRAARRHHRN